MKKVILRFQIEKYSNLKTFFLSLTFFFLSFFTTKKNVIFTQQSLKDIFKQCFNRIWMKTELQSCVL